MSAATLLSDEERLDWLQLARSDNIGPATFSRLMQRYGSAGAALNALPELIRRGGGRALRIYARDKAEAELHAVTAHAAKLVAMGEPHYPPLLRHAATAPPLLYIAGKMELTAMDAIAVVGARNASAIGRKFTRMIAERLGQEGFMVVSGLARGIDTAAHEASLPKHTAAVVAGGIDHFYPPENEALQRAIAKQGLLISEMGLGAVPKAEHFPRRNRIISGMARATIVVEAALRSGSLITARYAAEQGREVFAVPGSPLDPRCEGTNKLIREGASIMTSVDDVVESLRQQTLDYRAPMQVDGGFALPPAAYEPQEKDRDRVIALLSPSPVSVDDLIRESQLPAASVSAVLLELEIIGRVAHTSASTVALVGT